MNVPCKYLCKTTPKVKFERETMEKIKLLGSFKFQGRRKFHGCRMEFDEWYGYAQMCAPIIIKLKPRTKNLTSHEKWISRVNAVSKFNDGENANATNDLYHLLKCVACLFFFLLKYLLLVLFGILTYQSSSGKLFPKKCNCDNSKLLIMDVVSLLKLKLKRKETRKRNAFCSESIRIQKSDCQRALHTIIANSSYKHRPFSIIV